MRSNSKRILDRSNNSGTYRTADKSVAYDWERVGLTIYAENVKTGKRTTFSSLAEMKRFADTGRR